MGSCCARYRKEMKINPDNKDNIGKNNSSNKNSTIDNKRNSKVGSEENDEKEINPSIVLTPRNIVVESVSEQSNEETGKDRPRIQLPREHLPKDKNTLLKNYKYLKDELDMDSEILDYFIQEDIFTHDQVDLITAENTRRNKVDCFLRTLLRSKGNAYKMFLEILTKTRNGYIRKRLEDETSVFPEEWPKSTIKDTRSILSQNKKIIIDNLQPEMVVDYLIQFEEFTIDEYEEIIAEKTRKGKSIEFVRILMSDSHLPRGYFIFLHALEKAGEDSLHRQLTEHANKTDEHDANQYVIDPSVVSSMTDVLAEEDDPLIDDDSVMLLEIKVKITSKRKSKAILEKLTNQRIEHEICDRLFSDTNCLLHSVIKGSIVIKIQECRKGSIKLMMEKGRRVAVTKILEIIFSHPDVIGLVDTKTFQVFEVHMVSYPKHKQVEEKLDSKAIIRRNIAFLTEELDAMKFMHLDIFNNVEKEKISKERHSSRAKGTECMIYLALDKSEEDLNKLVDEIKRRKEYVWNHMFKTIADKGNPLNALVSIYDFLVENLYPSNIINPCCQSNILDFDWLRLLFSYEGQRSLRSKYILQDIMKKQEEVIIEFMRILSAFQPEMMILPVKGVRTLASLPETKEEENNTTDVGEIVESLPPLVRPMKEKDKQPQEGVRTLASLPETKEEENNTTDVGEIVESLPPLVRPMKEKDKQPQEGVRTLASLPETKEEENNTTDVGEIVESLPPLVRPMKEKDKQPQEGVRTLASLPETKEEENNTTDVGEIVESLPPLVRPMKEKDKQPQEGVRTLASLPETKEEENNTTDVGEIVESLPPLVRPMKEKDKQPQEGVRTLASLPETKEEENNTTDIGEIVESLPPLVRPMKEKDKQPQEGNRESGYLSLERTPITKRKIIDNHGLPVTRAEDNPFTATIGQITSTEDEGEAGLEV